jgi:hypothetical protein
MNIMQILCTYVCKWKNDTIPVMGRGIKQSGGGGEFKYNIFATLWELF